MDSLNSNDIIVVEKGGVEPNPKLSFIRDAIAIAKAEKVEFILAVGGGSVIDSCKYTALGAVTDKDVWDIATGKEKPVSALPVGCILTHSAAGSEMSSSAVITNMDNNMKKGLSSELNRCKFAIMNPELTFTVSKYQTACGIVDIMAHTMERYFTTAEPTDLTDRISESILKSVINAGKILMENPKDYNARANMMWASSLSHNNLTGCGRENFLAVHQLEHAVSGIFDEVAHGAGLAVLYPAWAKFVLNANPKRFATFARGVFDIKEDDDLKAGAMGIEKLSEFFLSLGMPSRLSDFNIKESDIDALALNCSFNKTRIVKSYIPLGFDEVKEIFNSCL
jgi:alcohol dehydrogenase YqhD (iron-dependent ADH family)